MKLTHTFPGYFQARCGHRDQSRSIDRWIESCVNIVEVMEFRRRLGHTPWNVKPQDHFILLREADNRPLSELTRAKSRCGQLCSGLRQRSPIVIGSLEGLMHRTEGFFKRPADFLRRRQLNFHRVCSCFSFACPFRRD